MSDSNVYTAERILAKRTKDGVTQYFIKWKGYKYQDNTWEPVENILDRGLLTAFERKEAKKTKRSSTSSSRAKRDISTKDRDPDDKEKSIKNSPATTSKVIPVQSPPPSSPKFEQYSNAASPNTPSRTKSPTNNSRSPLIISTPPQISPKTPPTTAGVSPKLSTSTPPPITTIVSRAAPSPTNSRFATYSPIVSNNVARSPNSTTTKTAKVQVESSMEPIEEITVNRINASSSPVRISSTPIPVNNILAAPQDNNVTINNSSNNNNNNLKANKRVANKFAILNTVITDVTVNDQTITISESKTNQGFFKEISRHSVAVDTTHAGECMDMAE